MQGIALRSRMLIVATIQARLLFIVTIWLVVSNVVCADLVNYFGRFSAIGTTGSPQSRTIGNSRIGSVAEPFGANLIILAPGVTVEGDATSGHRELKAKAIVNASQGPGAVSRVSGEAQMEISQSFSFTMTPSNPGLIGEPAWGTIPIIITPTSSLAFSLSGNAFDITGGAKYTLTTDTVVPNPHTPYDRLQQTFGRKYKTIGQPVREEGIGVMPSHSITIPVRWGDRIGLTMEIEVLAQATLESKVSGDPRTADAVADFGNTVRWGGITATDLAGNPITDFTALDDFGTDWRYSSVAVPEPSGFGLAVLTAAGVWRIRRLRMSFPDRE